MRDAIEPTVAKYLESLSAENAAVQISHLRQVAETLARNESERKVIRQQIHGPTMALRRGEIVDIEAILDDIRANSNVPYLQKDS